MFYKGHVIRDTSLILGKIKGQRLVNSEKLRDSFSYLLPYKVSDSNMDIWYILSPGLLSSNQETFRILPIPCLKVVLGFWNNKPYDILAYKGQDYVIT